MKRCPTCGDENADRARFCQNCATPLLDADVTVSDTRKIVTIVFADVTGSTALGERLDPEALRHVMGRYFDAVSVEIERHGGTVEKFIGDAVMAVFGIPQLHEDDAVRAVRAAVGMRAALERLNEDVEREHGRGLQARIGVNTGEVIAGDPTAGHRLVTGDAVNVAARLEQSAAPDEILIGEPTYRLVKDAVDVEVVAPLSLRGKADPVAAYRLISVASEAAGHRRRLDSPMVGRSKELAMLRHALDRVVTERTCHLFTLLGPAGVGKSRLVAEFLADAGPQMCLLQGRCLSYGQGITFFPLGEVVRAAAGIIDTDPPAVARAKLDELVVGIPDAARVAALVAGLFGWAEPGTTDDASWAIRKLIEHIARDRPLLLVFDDVHWAEPTFLELIEYLAEWIRDAPVLVLCIARPELREIRPAWAGGMLNATSILLEPLPDDEAAMLVDNLLGDANIPSAARARILEAAEGNPLFVEEMLAMLIDDGLLRMRDGAWRPAAELADLTVPPTIQLLLAARLDRLDAEERAIIERGAVEGKVFHAGAVASLSAELVRPRVPSRLLALARKELIRPDRAEFAGEDAFRFRHLLIRDAAYHAMPKEQRAELHERFADWLAAAAGERRTEYAEILGHHLHEAYRYRGELGIADERTERLGRRAGEHLFDSAVRAYEREDLGLARRLLELAVPLAEGPSALASMALLAEVLEDVADYGAAIDAARRTIELAYEVGDEHHRRRARLVEILSVGQVDPAATVTKALEEATAVLDEAGAADDVLVRDRAALVLSRLWFFIGKVAETFRILEELAPRAAELPRRDRYDVARGLSTSAYFGVTPAGDALDAVERASELFGESIAGEIFRLRVTGALLAMLGRFDEMREAFARASTMSDEIGRPVRSLISRQVEAEALMLERRTEDAIELLAEMVETFDALGETGFNSTICGTLAVALCHAGRFEDADAFAERSLHLAAEDDFASQVLWRMARARVLAARGEDGKALGLVREATAINDRTDYLVFQAEAYETLAHVHDTAGRRDEAEVALRDALDRYERKGSVVAARRVAERL